MSKNGYMLFLREDPAIGLSPQPVYAPVPLDHKPETAEDFCKTYLVKESFEEAAHEATKAYEAAVESGAAEELDVIFPVSVSDTGGLTVYTQDGSEIACFTKDQIFASFGMNFEALEPLGAEDFFGAEI
jgi:hypothetical protein